MCDRGILLATVSVAAALLGNWTTPALACDFPTSGPVNNSASISCIAVVSIPKFSGGIASNGTISAEANDGFHATAITTFSSGISNSGTLLSSNDGIAAFNVSTYSGGVNNSGSITADLEPLSMRWLLEGQR
jgi:hypothetical protein